jgi:hypothetical protein
MFLDDIDYLVDQFTSIISIKAKRVHPHCMKSRSSYVISSNAPLAYSLVQMHHTGSQEEVQEEQTGTDPQEI